MYIPIDIFALFIDAAFQDPGKSQSIPTLIAFSLALAQRVFAQTSKQGANILLRIIHMFGLSLVSLGGPPNLLQSTALDSIPKDIETIERRFNLDASTVLHAVCPNCNYTYPPFYHPESPSKPSYPDFCSNKSPPDAPPCGTPLLQSSGAPVKVFEYYSFLQWLSHFVAQPHVEQLADEFCDAVKRSNGESKDKMETSDGSFYAKLLGPDGRSFVINCGNECHLVFLMHVDFFQPEGTTGRGKAHSTGIISMRCLNLPLAIREDPVNVYIAGFIRGPKEPSSLDSQHSHFLRPLVEDLTTVYYRGIQCSGSAVEDGNSLKPGAGRVFRGAIAGLNPDLKAARPTAGLLDVGSHFFCSFCGLHHQVNITRTDYKNWGTRDDNVIQEGMKRWTKAGTTSQREAIENQFGTRYSEFIKLSYFSFVMQLIVDPMHTIFLRVVLALWEILGLRNPDLKKPETPFIPKVNPIAFYYDFSLPPGPSIVSLQEESIEEDISSDEYLAYVEWNNLAPEEQELRNHRFEKWLKETIKSERRSVIDVFKGHQVLAKTCPQSSTEKNALIKSLKNLHWISLLYICNDLWVPPISTSAKYELQQQDINKASMAEALADWVSLASFPLLLKSKVFLSFVIENETSSRDPGFSVATLYR